MICFIPTKSRFNTKTYSLFEKVGIKVYHFIEPSELSQYNVPNKVSIEKDNQGVSYVRNFMLDFAKQKKIDWVIICDDDVTAFGIYNGKTIKTDAGIWKEIYEKAKNLPFEVVGINYAQHAWHEKTKYSINKKLAEVCILLNASKINWSYKPNTKEDRDFQLQTIKNGSGVLRFNHYWFQCPNVGSNSGGLYELYKAKKDTEWAKKLSQDWHPFVKVVKKNDRIDAKIDLKSFSLFYKKQIK
jgi:glycosyltransferase involved in cell wall biosynthesis